MNKLYLRIRFLCSNELSAIDDPDYIFEANKGSVIQKKIADEK
jgi:hypothetical protein